MDRVQVPKAARGAARSLNRADRHQLKRCVVERTGEVRQPVSQPLSHRVSQRSVGDRHGTQPITRPEGQNFRLDQAEPFRSSRVGVMAKQRERTGFEPPTVEEQAVTAKRLRCCDQVGEDELPVRIKCNRELVGQPV